MRRIWGMTLIGVLATGCAAFLANTDISLVNLRLTSATSTDQTVETTFKVLSRNNGENRVVGVLYRLLVRTEEGWVEVAEGYSVQDLRLPTNQEVSLAYSFPVEGAAERSLAASGVRDGQYRLEGELRVMSGLGQIQMPFGFDGKDEGPGGLEGPSEPPAT